MTEAAFCEGSGKQPSWLHGVSNHNQSPPTGRCRECGQDIELCVGASLIAEHRSQERGESPNQYRVQKSTGVWWHSDDYTRATGVAKREANEDRLPKTIEVKHDGKWIGVPGPPVEPDGPTVWMLLRPYADGYDFRDIVGLFSSRDAADEYAEAERYDEHPAWSSETSIIRWRLDPPWDREDDQ